MTKRKKVATPQTTSFPLGMRIGAGIVSLGLFAFSYGGYAVWSIAKFYFASVKPVFYLVLAAAFVLFCIAVFWMYFAIVGHKRLAKELNYGILGVTISLAILTCIFIATFF